MWNIDCYQRQFIFESRQNTKQYSTRGGSLGTVQRRTKCKNSWYLHSYFSFLSRNLTLYRAIWIVCIMKSGLIKSQQKDKLLLRKSEILHLKRKFSTAPIINRQLSRQKIRQRISVFCCFWDKKCIKMPSLFTLLRFCDELFDVITFWRCKNLCFKVSITNMLYFFVCIRYKNVLLQKKVWHNFKACY